MDNLDPCGWFWGCSILRSKEVLTCISGHPQKNPHVKDKKKNRISLALAAKVLITCYLYFKSTSIHESQSHFESTSHRHIFFATKK